MPFDHWWSIQFYRRRAVVVVSLSRTPPGLRTTTAPPGVEAVGDRHVAEVLLLGSENLAETPRQIWKGWSEDKKRSQMKAGEICKSRRDGRGGVEPWGTSAPIART
jgi:hypothetical protein